MIVTFHWNTHADCVWRADNVDLCACMICVWLSFFCDCLVRFSLRLLSVDYNDGGCSLNLHNEFTKVLESNGRPWM